MDFATVDALARLQLGAKRLGLRVVLRNPPARLADLIAFAGLAEVLPVERQRQPEQREERLGVEEEGELPDPPVA